MLDLIEEALDQVALLVDVLVVGDDLRSGSAGGNDGFGTDCGDAGAKPIGIVAFVGQQMFEGYAADQVLGLNDVIDLAACEDEPSGVAQRIHADTDLCAQAATRTPDRLIFAAPFAPAACWWARTMVESMIRYSKSGFSTNALKTRSQTPFLAQRRKRWKTLFQLPNSCGRSRQGAPARAIQSTASTNRRLSSPCRPLSPFLPGTRCSMRSHCASVHWCRIQTALLSCDLESHSRVGGNPLCQPSCRPLGQPLRRLP